MSQSCAHWWVRWEEETGMEVPEELRTSGRAGNFSVNKSGKRHHMSAKRERRKETEEVT